MRRFLPVFSLFFILCWLIAACKQEELLGDDITWARAAILRHDWPLAERLLERTLRDEQDPDRRWEAWTLLLDVVGNGLSEERARLEFLEIMLGEFADNDARAKVVLRDMGLLNEKWRRYRRAAEVWSTYIGLGGLSPTEEIDGYRHLARAQFSRRHFEAGESTLAQCLALPLEAIYTRLCMFDLADYSQSHGRWQEVVDLTRQILETQPEKELAGLAGYLLADALEQQGKKEKALQVFEGVRESYPNPLVIENRIALLRKKKRP